MGGDGLVTSELTAHHEEVKKRQLLRARVLLPISHEPIENGAVLIAGAKILKVGRWKDLKDEPRSDCTDLGEVLLLPGLVNAHCHLDYTHMAGQLPPPKRFTDWLKQITELKAGWDKTDYANSWLAGARMLLESGTTTAADIEAVPGLLPKMWDSTPLRVISFFEMIGITRKRPPADILQEALRQMDALGATADRTGLSPHAPYSTLPELLRLTAVAARNKRCRIMIHVAESAVEFEMFAKAKGEMHDWLSGAKRDMSDCGSRTPVQHLHHCGLLSGRLIAAHANYLGRGDAALLADNHVSVVHCPRTHFYFGHGTSPVRRLIKAGVNVALGTDSLASVYRKKKEQVTLSLFEEMRTLAQAEPTLSPRRIVGMATTNAAKAIGMSGRVGEITSGACADLVCIPLQDSLRAVCATVLNHRGPVLGSMVAGQWALQPPGLK